MTQIQSLADCFPLVQQLQAYRQTESGKAILVRDIEALRQAFAQAGFCSNTPEFSYQQRSVFGQPDVLLVASIHLWTQGSSLETPELLVRVVLVLKAHLVDVASQPGYQASLGAHRRYFINAINPRATGSLGSYRFESIQDTCQASVKDPEALFTRLLLLAATQEQQLDDLALTNACAQLVQDVIEKIAP